MAISFKTGFTKKGNLKVPSVVHEMLGGNMLDDLLITIEPVENSVHDGDDDSIRIPREVFEEAGIDEDNGFFIYTECGKVIIVEDDNPEDY